MAQCIITSFEDKVAVYFNDIIRQAEIEITDIKRKKLIHKNFKNIDHMVIELNEKTAGYVDVKIQTENETFKKRVFINTKKVRL